MAGISQALQNIEQMPESSFDEIADKYVEMNVTHPFREGNGRTTRIWLDLILKKRLGQCKSWETAPETWDSFHSASHASGQLMCPDTGTDAVR